MSQQTIALLLVAVRESIAAAEASAPRGSTDRVLHRILAHLWSAHDELVSAQRSLSL